MREGDLAVRKSTVLTSKGSTDFILETHKGTKLRAVCLSPTQPERLEQVLAENYASIFPEYDPQLHDIERLDYCGLPCAVVLYDKSKPCSDVVFSPGYYDYCFDFTGQDFLKRAEAPVEEAYVDLPTAIQAFTSDISLFVANEDVYRKRGIRYRRAALLYGPPGNGKTCEIVRRCRFLVEEHDFAIITISMRHFPEALKAYRPHLYASKAKGFVFVIEELTGMVDSDMESLLSFLDGPDSWENSYVVATTNYADKIPANLISRPGRFDLVIEVPNPDAVTRRRFLEGFTKTEVDGQVILETDKFSIAYLREAVIKGDLEKISLLEAVRAIKQARDKVTKDFAQEVGNYQ